MNPILLLHGALGASAQLLPIKSEFETNGRNVYLMDFSGHHGKPFKERFGIETFAEDVLDFMNAQKLLKVDIFGYSMGGYVALWLAHLHPEKVSKIITLGTKFDWSRESAEKEVRKLDAEKILLKVPAFARILESRHKPNDWKILLQRTSEMMNELGSHPLLSEEIIQSIQARTVIYLGDRDDMADRKYSERVGELLPNGEFVLLPDTEHAIEKINVGMITGTT
jgi:pimeloyl-ACP methyl ester carboxylesterase